MTTATPTVGQCKKAGESLLAEHMKFYAERIDPLDSKIAELRQKGEDPTKALVSDKDGITIYANYLKLRDVLIQARDSSLGAVVQQIADCKEDALPNWVGDQQKILDLVIALNTLSLSVLGVDPKVFNVDLGEIYKGKPFGGKEALIPKARDDVLRSLGIEGDVAIVIKQPDKPFKELAKRLGIKWR